MLNNQKIKIFKILPMIEKKIGSLMIGLICIVTSSLTFNIILNKPQDLHLLTNFFYLLLLFLGGALFFSILENDRKIAFSSKENSIERYFLTSILFKLFYLFGFLLLCITIPYSFYRSLEPGNIELLTFYIKSVAIILLICGSLIVFKQIVNIYREVRSYLLSKQNY